MANFCTNCGISLPNDIKFCTDCGNKIGQEIPIEDKSKEIKEVENRSEISQDVNEIANNEGEIAENKRQISPTKSIENTSSGIDAKYIIIGVITLITVLFFVFSQNLNVFSNASGTNEIIVEGRWNALWETDPNAFGSISGVTIFKMYGEFIFSGNRVTIIANGNKGNIFGEERLENTQYYRKTEDKIYLDNGKNQKQIEYTIVSMKNNKIELQLMDDIFITLER